mmetsp:Transcript_63550/g.136620  ORF Transcript_63550/g.136620 Transcript_63550/m.136620 type:complete len:331 (+) Transcript_63550:642-1634(+)
MTSSRRRRRSPSRGCRARWMWSSMPSRSAEGDWKKLWRAAPSSAPTLCTRGSPMWCTTRRTASRCSSVSWKESSFWAVPGARRLSMRLMLPKPAPATARTIFRSLSSNASGPAVMSCSAATSANSVLSRSIRAERPVASAFRAAGGPGTTDDPSGGGGMLMTHFPAPTVTTTMQRVARAARIPLVVHEGFHLAALMKDISKSLALMARCCNSRSRSPVDEHGEEGTIKGPREEGEDGAEVKAIGEGEKETRRRDGGEGATSSPEACSSPSEPPISSASVFQAAPASSGASSSSCSSSSSSSCSSSSSSSTSEPAAEERTMESSRDNAMGG